MLHKKQSHSLSLELAVPSEYKTRGIRPHSDRNRTTTVSTNIPSKHIKANMHQHTTPPSTHRRWTPAEDSRLEELRFIHHLTWPNIALALNRTTQAVTGRWHHLKIAHCSSFEDWNAALDERIIDGRRLGLTCHEIGDEMELPAEAVQGRWYELRQKNKVPADVVAIWRRKQEVKWSEEEDETILRVWKSGKNKEELIECVRFEGKFKCDVQDRYRVLLRERGAVYRRVMGLDEAKPVPHALDRALGKKKFAWME
ncbi:hypothetical protein OPT61_g2799 [Boeremia exigua]|uniref:Uncharacterized protein n=1 Tax=Boeremia exigua TaxID=749465 RepID=A0ACC2IK72_9PLEO|nr:hypothetical protein OPT61_g2799 [Boeremia exigua]